MKRKPIAPKTLLSIFLASMMLFSFTSCSGDKKDTAFLDQIPEAEAYSDDANSSEEISEEITEDGYTKKPSLIHQFNIEPNKLIIAGECEENSTVKAYNLSSSKIIETKSKGTYYVMEIPLEGTSMHHYELTAIVDGKKESKANPFSAKFDAVAEKPADGTAVSIGKDSSFFYDSLLPGYTGTNLLTNTQISEFKTKIQNKAKTDGVKYVYVMIPDMLTVNNEIIPDYITKESYNTKFQQISGILSSIDTVDVIDLTETFEANKNGDYPIYYNTSSNLSDYGSYLAYQAIMNYISGKDTPATDATSEEVSIEVPASVEMNYLFNKVTGTGGDIVTSLGIKNDIFVEEYYYAQKDFTSTFPEDAECTCLPSDLVIYSDKETNALYTDTTDDEVFGANEIYSFKTNREELPTAVFLRDDSANAIIPMLAESFNNAYFAAQFDFSANAAAMKSHASSSDEKVDYVFIIVSEGNIDYIA